MGFFSSFFGNAQADDARVATQRANAELRAREQQARTELQGGLTNQLNSLQGGYDTARTGLQTGYDAARGALNTGYDAAGQRINTGYDRAIGAQEDYLNRTTNILNPYIQAGQRAGTMYGDYLGMNGEGARTAAVDAYRASNPLYQEVDSRANEEMLRTLNSQGVTGGRLGMMMTRSAQQRGEDRLNSYLNRLDSMYGRGQTASGQLAGFTDATGQRIGSYEQGRGTTLGQLDVNRGTATADLTARGADNMATLDYRYGSDRGNAQNAGANTLANLTYGVGQQIAGNHINLGNAVANSRTMGINNILGLAGTIFGGFSPTRAGTSTFGNMYNSLTGGGIR